MNLNVKQAHHSVALWPWANYLPFLILSFLNVNEIINPRISIRNNIHKVPAYKEKNAP